MTESSRPNPPTEWHVRRRQEVSLSKLQHILLSVGVRVPLERARGAQVQFLTHPVGMVRWRAVPVLEEPVRSMTPLARALWLLSLLLAAPHAQEEVTGSRR